MRGKDEPDTFSADTPEQAFAAIVEGRKMPGYEPAYDWGLANAGGGVEAAHGIAWETAPYLSHIHSYRWLDARWRRRMGDFPSKLGQGRSSCMSGSSGRTAGRPESTCTSSWTTLGVRRSTRDSGPRPTRSARCSIPR